MTDLTESEKAKQSKEVFESLRKLYYCWKCGHGSDSPGGFYSWNGRSVCGSCLGALREDEGR